MELQIASVHCSEDRTIHRDGQKRARVSYRLFESHILSCLSTLVDQKWLSGLGLWFRLWVQEVPGSNPGWALVIILFCLWCWYRGPKINARGHSDLNQGPTGLQPGALPLSYIPNLQITWKITFTFTLFHKEDKKCFCQKGDSNPCPHKRTRNLILTSYQEARIEPWVWRLRPLGHSDIGDKSRKIVKTQSLDLTLSDFGFLHPQFFQTRPRVTLGRIFFGFWSLKSENQWKVLRVFWWKLPTGCPLGNQTFLRDRL